MNTNRSGIASTSAPCMPNDVDHHNIAVLYMYVLTSRFRRPIVRDHKNVQIQSNKQDKGLSVTTPGYLMGVGFPRVPRCDSILPPPGNKTTALYSRGNFLLATKHDKFVQANCKFAWLETSTQSLR